jgi:uncharacterized membrane protein
MAKTSMNLEENIAGLLCYVLTWVTGIIFLLMEKENDFVRFHAMQSIVVFLPLTILGWIFGAIGAALFWRTGGAIIFSAIGWLIWILTLILWIILMLKAYQGEKYKLPVVGDFAEERASA